VTDLDLAAQETADFEGMRTNPYKDTRGLWTIGEGRCLETSPLTGAEWKYLLDAGLVAITITALGARHLTEERIADIDHALDAALIWYHLLPEPVQRILVEMAYQLGVESLLGFHNFLDLVSKRQYSAAATDGRGTAWYRQTPNRAEALMKRLEAVS
jgi:lysozyme